MNPLTQAGITAYKTGDKANARSLFEQATQENDKDIQAWLGLAATASTASTRLDCFVRVLHLDANNATAMKGLVRMVTQDEVTVQVREQAMPILESKQGKRPSEEQVVFQVRPAMYLMILRAMGLFAFIGFIAILGFTGSDFLSNVLTVVSIVLLVFSFLAVLYAVLTYRATCYTLTTQHLIVSDGILNRSRKTIPIQRIQDVAFHQSWQERLLGLGHVVVESAGEYGSMRLREMADSQQRADQILKVINQ